MSWFVPTVVHLYLISNFNLGLFDVRYLLTLRLQCFILLADLWEHIADTGLAVRLSVAVEDVFNAVEHLLSRTTFV